MNIILIYCGNGNHVLQRIAIRNKFKYGLKLPQIKNIDEEPLYFSDQDWKNPDKKKYINSVKKYSPTLATVIDIEKRSQLKDAIDWAEGISNHVERIIFIPKCTGVIKNIPREVNNAKTMLGYSVPTKYGGTNLNPHLFDGWKIHLLGGSPHKQIEYSRFLDVYSIDCNYHSMKANKFGEFWTGKMDDTRWWRRVDNESLSPREKSLMAFDISCKNIYDYWNKVSK